MRDQDFDGLQDRAISTGSAMHDMELAERILNQIDFGERPTSGEMLFLRWYCGLSLNPPIDFRQTEMYATDGE